MKKFILFLLSLPLLAAIPADTEWEIRADIGDDTNGGGFSKANKGTTGVDMTYGANYAVVSFNGTLSASGTTTLTDSAGGFTNTMLGNVINIAGQGFYCIVGYTDTNNVTVDRALGTFSGASGKVGGALATPGRIDANNAVSGNNVIHIKAATYTITSTSSGVSGGKIYYNTAVVVEGYGSTRWDLGTRPLITVQSGITSIRLLEIYNGLAMNFTIDCASQSGTIGFFTGANGGLRYAEVRNCGSYGIVGGGSGIFQYIESHHNGGYGAGGIQNCYYCYFHHNTSHGLQTNGGTNSGNFSHVISAFNGGYGIYTSYGNQIRDSIMYGNTNSGLFAQESYGQIWVNNISYGNGGYGFQVSNSTNDWVYANNNAVGNNTSGDWYDPANRIRMNVNPTTLTANPFVSPSAGDFSLNSTTGGGALLRDAGYPQWFDAAKTTTPTRKDVGAVDKYQYTGGGVTLAGGAYVQ